MDNRVMIFVVIGIMAIIWAGLALKRRQTFRKLQGHLSAGNFGEFFALAESTTARVLFPERDLLFYKLNAYILNNDMKAAYAAIEALLARKSSTRPRTELVVKAFNVYLSQQDRKRARAMLREIEGWDDRRLEPIKRDCRRMYDIAISGSSAYLDEMLDELERVASAERGRLEYLIALQYENKGDHVRRDEYLKLARNDMFPVPEA